MTDIFGGVPTGRRLDEESLHPPGRIGLVGVLRPATKELVELLRRRLREIDDADLVQDGKVLTDTSDGSEYVVVTSFMDPVDPAEARVEAFAVRDHLIVPLRPRDAVEPSRSPTAFAAAITAGAISLRSWTTRGSAPHAAAVSHAHTKNASTPGPSTGAHADGGGRSSRAESCVVPAVQPADAPSLSTGFSSGASSGQESDGTSAIPTTNRSEDPNTSSATREHRRVSERERSDDGVDRGAVGHTPSGVLHRVLRTDVAGRQRVLHSVCRRAWTAMFFRANAGNQVWALCVPD